MFDHGIAYLATVKIRKEEEQRRRKPRR